VIQIDHAVGSSYRLPAMRDQDAREQHRLDGLADEALALRVEMAGRLIEKTISLDRDRPRAR